MESCAASFESEWGIAVVVFLKIDAPGDRNHNKSDKLRFWTQHTKDGEERNVG